MNKEQIRKSVGHWVRLIPIAHRLDGLGYPLKQVDDVWRIESVTDDGVRLHLPRTGHSRKLGFDYIHHYTTDRIEHGSAHGFLTLNVQLSVQGNNVDLLPTRPGESVSPRIPLDPIRLTLLQRLRDTPGKFVPAGDLTGFRREDVISEMVRCDDEGMVEARLLRGGCEIIDAVALRLRPRGSEWLRQQRL